MINPLQFEALVVRPCLNMLAEHDARLASDASVTLMLGTAAQESDFGYYMRQHPRGPGRGPWQVEGTTHRDVWRYLRRSSNKPLLDIVAGMSIGGSYSRIPDEAELVYNLRYSCAIARIKFWMIPEALPEDLEGLGEYWDVYYNANPDHGTAEQWLEKYRYFVEGEG